MGKTFTNTSNPKSARGGASAKAASALAKQAQAQSQLAAAEDQEWNKGAKDSSKKSEAAAKKQQAASARAERDAILAAEEAANKSEARNAKTAVKKGSAAPARAPSKIPEWNEEPLPTLSATGIDAALSLLTVTDGDSNENAEANKIERHPERRVKAAYSAFEKRRLAEMENENTGDKKGGGNLLRRTQRIELIRREFEKSAENPWNQVHVSVGMAAEGRREVLRGVRKEEEALLREK